LRMRKRKRKIEIYLLSQYLDHKVDRKNPFQEKVHFCIFTFREKSSEIEIVWEHFFPA